jgi:hypothetical protein
VKHDDWVRRFVVEFQKVSGHPQKLALHVANASWLEREDDMPPEEAARTEYSYWTDDAR